MLGLDHFAGSEVCAVGDPMVFQAVGAALLASGLTAFLIEGFRWDRTHHGV